jgi:hypothetical protein
MREIGRLDDKGVVWDVLKASPGSGRGEIFQGSAERTRRE